MGQGKEEGLGGEEEIGGGVIGEGEVTEKKINKREGVK